MNQTKVAKAIEEICAEGCIRVNEIITELEKGNNIEQTQDLSDEEANIVLTELKTIMSVYTTND